MAAIIFIANLLFVPQAQAIRPETVAAGLQNPWGLAFLPGGRFLVTERPGRLRVVASDGKPVSYTHLTLPTNREV